MHPTAHRLLAKCDGVLRLPGASTGADNDVRIARERGIPVWFDLAEIPDAADQRACCASHAAHSACDPRKAFRSASP